MRHLDRKTGKLRPFQQCFACGGGEPFGLGHLGSAVINWLRIEAGRANRRCALILPK
jgi:hypothetical protein